MNIATIQLSLSDSCIGGELKKSKKYDLGLETLLEMSGEIFPMDSGYWTKIEAKPIIPIMNIFHME